MRHVQLGFAEQMALLGEVEQRPKRHVACALRESGTQSTRDEQCFVHELEAVAFAADKAFRRNGAIGQLEAAQVMTAQP
ncbi:hypothetical protein D3C84_994110 [compost metagenome]